MNRRKDIAFTPLGRRAMAGVGVTLMGLSVLMVPLPAPLGLPLFLLGGSLLLRHSHGSRRSYLRARRQFPRLFGPIDRLRSRSRLIRQSRNKAAPQ